MKIAFMGSPLFAREVLARLLTAKQHQVVCVVTQPDAPVGRGQQVKFNQVKELALSHQISVLQPNKISADVAPLMAYHPDIIVTCAFGQILQQNVLDAAPYGVINVHGSLLPQYRGAAPIQWAVINGEKETGITIAQTELGLDCGPIITQLKTAIQPNETAGDLFARLPELGAQALIMALDQIAAGTATFTPQDTALVSQAPLLNKTMAQLDWQQSATRLANLVRGLNPWPVAYFLLDQVPVKVYQATALAADQVGTLESVAPGTVVACSPKTGLVVACGQGLLRIEQLQLPGKKIISGQDFCNGRTLNAVHL